MMKNTEKKSSSNDVSYNVFGWEINSLPPEITERGGFLESPTKSIDFEATTCCIIPSQSVSPTDVGGDMLSLSRVDATDKGGFWFFEDSMNGGLWLALDLNILIPKTFYLTLSICATKYANANYSDTSYSIHVNGHEVIMKNEDRNMNWHNSTHAIDGRYLKTGENSISITGGGGSGIWVKSVSLSTDEKFVIMGYFWKQVYAGLLFPGDSKSKKVSYTVGDTSSIRETDSFVETLGASVSVGGAGVLSGISAQMSKSFSTSRENSHEISISEISEESSGESFSCPATAKSKTFQLWQLQMYYYANSVKLTQAIGFHKLPLIPREYIEY